MAEVGDKARMYSGISCDGIRGGAKMESDMGGWKRQCSAMVLRSPCRINAWFWAIPHHARKGNRLKKLYPVHETFAVQILAVSRGIFGLDGTRFRGKQLCILFFSLTCLEPGFLASPK